MNDPPPEIRLFETLQIVSIMIGLVNGFAADDGSLIDVIITTGPILILTVLVSRKRKNWAKWVLVVGFIVCFAAALGMMMSMHDLVLAQGYSVVAVGVGVTLLQAIAIALLCTRRASLWLKGLPCDA